MNEKQLKLTDILEDVLIYLEDNTLEDCYIFALNHHANKLKTVIENRKRMQRLKNK